MKKAFVLCLALMCCSPAIADDGLTCIEVPRGCLEVFMKKMLKSGDQDFIAMAKAMREQLKNNESDTVFVSLDAWQKIIRDLKQ